MFVTQRAIVMGAVVCAIKHTKQEAYTPECGVLFQRLAKVKMLHAHTMSEQALGQEESSCEATRQLRVFSRFLSHPVAAPPVLGGRNQPCAATAGVDRPASRGPLLHGRWVCALAAAVMPRAKYSVTSDSRVCACGTAVRRGRASAPFASGGRHQRMHRHHHHTASAV